MRFNFPPDKNGGWYWGLQHEWIDTNGLGGYSSGTIVGCNTRKYHGLFVANLPHQADRHVLLSTLEETVTYDNTSFSLSSRQHPDVFYPQGHYHLVETTTRPYPELTYRYQNSHISKALLWLYGQQTLIIRYIFYNIPLHTQLSIRPLLAYRSFHSLTQENNALNTHVAFIDNGIQTQPYLSLPPLTIQTSVSHYTFVAKPDWCRKVHYSQEEDRGFPAEEDLFMPGEFIFPDLHETPYHGTLYLVVGVEPFSPSPNPTGPPSANEPSRTADDLLGNEGSNSFAYLSSYSPAHPFTSANSTKSYFTAIESAWKTEVDRRQCATNAHPVRPFPTAIQTELAETAESFIVRQPYVGTSILAGYHWFNAWGRDSFIALPGLCFCTGRHELGKKILVETCTHAKNGLVPNILSPDGNHAYNSVDASLWYIWAVQQLTRFVPDSQTFIQEELWPFLKSITRAYLHNSPEITLSMQGEEHNSNTTKGATTIATEGVPFTRVDKDGLLHVGTPQTQLTWMDAMAYGRAVTPRDGYPVEMNALWYNALSFVNFLAKEFGESPVFSPLLLRTMPHVFMHRFWIDLPSSLAPSVSPRPSELPYPLELPYPTELPYRAGPSSSFDSGYLADVWRETNPSFQIRPNQIFAVAMPYPLVQDKAKAQSVVNTVTAHLLTPYGLRTLSPSDSDYCPRYEGGPDERDSAYHQGTVWPWLLGAYTDALMQTSDDKKLTAANLLTTISPLLHQHIHQAGVGSVSEIFDASAPHRPNGCISQAWSVAELLRLMETINTHCPGMLEHHVSQQGE